VSRLFNVGTLSFWRHCVLNERVVESASKLGLVCVCLGRDKLM
jgi:hypothetical protein